MTIDPGPSAETLPQTVAAPRAVLARGAMLAWRSECYRSMATARAFGVPLHLIQRSRPGGKVQKALGYLANGWASLAVLRRDRPKTVICINLPPFLPVLCAAYARLTGGQVILDFHSGALTKAQWRPFLGFYRRLVRRAPFTLCHNRQDAAQITQWGGRALHMFALPQRAFAGHSYTPPTERGRIFFVCSFADDEPTEIALEAMRACPEIDFVISGNYRKRGLSNELMAPNIRFAGFLDYDTYLATMAGSSAVLTLSTRPHIMQMAVHEAITLGTPVITNGAETLREVLGAGGVFTAIEPQALAAAFRACLVDHPARIAGMVAAKEIALGSILAQLQEARTRKPDLFV